APDARDRLRPDLEIRIGIEIDVLGVAPLEVDAELQRGGSVDVLGPEILDRVALLFRVDEGPLDVGLLADLPGLVGGLRLRVAPPLERLEIPRLLAVGRFDRRQTLERRLRADHSRTLLHLAERDVDLVVAERE